ncbi:hypothetical protein EZS27_024452 [termite gut metagenome]|uniref:DUF4365 domain-containing protein n=1 Tax=termite gut metagenome TaxID=433724 RepID=A0A5J4QYR8_9ZZZZ
MTDELKVLKHETVDRVITTEILNSLFDDCVYEFKEDRYNGIDMCCTATSKQQSFTMDIEVKYRKILLSTYKTTMLELEKYNALLQYANKYKVYSVIYPFDDVVYLFNLNRIDFAKIEKINIPLPAETLTNGTTYDRRKNVFLVPFHFGTSFQYDCSEYYTH